MKYKYWKSIEGSKVRFYRSAVKDNSKLPLHSKSSLREVVRAANGEPFEWVYLFDLPIQYARFTESKIVLDVPWNE